MTVNIEISREGPVAVLALNRPEKHNACTSSMLSKMRTTMDELNEDPALRCIVLTGRGESFCSGSDVSEITGLTPSQAARRTQLDYGSKLAVAQSRSITIAAIHGFCLGGGLELAAACDLRLAAEDAVFGLPEMALGSLPGSGGVQRLSGIVGYGRATEWVLTGRRFGVEEAHSAGLISEVNGNVDGVHARAMQLASELAEHSPIAVQVCKALLDPNSPRAPRLDSTIHGLAASNLRSLGALQAGDSA